MSFFNFLNLYVIHVNMNILLGDFFLWTSAIHFLTAISFKKIYDLPTLFNKLILYIFVLVTNEPLEGFDFFDVLLDTIDSAGIRYPGYRHRFVGLLFHILNDFCSRSTC